MDLVRRPGWTTVRPSTYLAGPFHVRRVRKASDPMEKKEIKCSFCGRDKQDTNVLIAGITGHICDSCITQAQNIISEELSQRTRARWRAT